MKLMFSSGLAIRDYWQVDDRTVVFVADPTFGKRSTIFFFVIVFGFFLDTSTGRT